MEAMVHRQGKVHGKANILHKDSTSRNTSESKGIGENMRYTQGLEGGRMVPSKPT